VRGEGRDERAENGKGRGRDRVGGLKNRRKEGERCDYKYLLKYVHYST
jgi:hypothetical protein